MYDLLMRELLGLFFSLLHLSFVDVRLHLSSFGCQLFGPLSEMVELAQLLGARIDLRASLLQHFLLLLKTLQLAFLEGDFVPEILQLWLMAISVLVLFEDPRL